MKKPVSPLKRIIEEVRESLRPPPDLKISEWADSYRYLSSESSAASGKWYTDRAPYQRGIMDVITDRHTEIIVLKTSAQVGKTEILNNVAGYYVDQDPSPILVVQPTLLLAEAWSKDRLVPMIRDTPVLHKKINTDRKRDGENTILHKRFPGGHITIAGANSPASLASRPVRILLLDEVDRYPFSAGTEGDPANLARARTKTFWNRKILMASSPTIKGLSRIDAAYQSSDQRQFYVPCPHCMEKQVLEWKQVKWEECFPENAVYICIHCDSVIRESDKPYMLKHGEWRAHKPFKAIAGFHLNELYSPWVTWGEMAVNFMDAKKLPETLKTFINTSLAELWEEDNAGDGIETEAVSNRVEKYSAHVPKGVYLLTAAVDVQDDRLEIEILGWGIDEETWSIDYIILHGDPAKRELWQEVDDVLDARYKHASGIDLSIICACVDSGGHHTEAVYDYCKYKALQKKRVYPVKGSSLANQPILGKSTRNNSHRVKLFMVGTDTAKETIYARLKIEEHGAGYMHHPDFYDEAYFEQLTAEKIVTRFHKGRTVRRWEKPQGRRNEALDLKVYNFVAYRIAKPNMEKVKERFLARVEKLGNPEPEKTVDNRVISLAVRNHRTIKRKGGFVKAWKA